MPAIVIQLLEALAVGVAAGAAAFGTTHDWSAALAAGIAGTAGKMSPRQLVGTSSAPPQT